MHDKILWIIVNYYSELKEPSYFDKANMIEMKSLSKWATMELYTYILEKNSTISAIEDFMFMMEDFAVNSKKNSHIFYTAADIARDIYDIVLASL